MNLANEFTTRGRLTRRAFWSRHLLPVAPVLWIVISAGASPGAPYDLPLAAALTGLLVSIWGRRLHDRGHSAWWLLAVLVPVAGALLLMVECGLRRSAAGADRFGPPRARRDDYLKVAPAPGASPSTP